MDGEVTATQDAAIRKAVREEIATLIEGAELSDDNVSRYLSARICCNGHMCGCRGSSVGEYLAYQIRTFHQ